MVGYRIGCGSGGAKGGFEKIIQVAQGYLRCCQPGNNRKKSSLKTQVPLLRGLKIC